MKNKLVLSAIIISFFISSFVSAQILFEWQNMYDHGAIDKALDVRNHGTTSIHVAGIRQSAGGWRIVTQKYSPSGTLYSTHTASTYLPGNLLFLDRDGSYNTFVITDRPGGGYCIIKYNYSGSQAWKKNFSERPVGLKIDAGGRAYTGGQAVGGFFARCYRANGTVRWARYDGDGAEAGGMDIDNSGNVYVGGIHESSLGDDDIRVTKFGRSSTVPLWATNYDSGGRDNVDLLKTDAVGNVYIAGEVDAYGSMGANVSVAKFNYSGIFQWYHFVTGAGGSSSAFERSLIVYPFQNPVLTGEKTDFYNVNPSGTTTRIFTTKLNRNTGASLYYVYPNDPTYSDMDISEEPICSFSDQYGNVYIGGTGNQGGGGGRWTITKTDGLDGTRRWIEAGTSMSGNNAVNDIFVAGDGDVYMANQENFSTVDFEIVKYSQPGGGLKLADKSENETTVGQPEKIDYTLFPNPSAEAFNVISSAAGVPFDMSVFDNTGKLIQVLKSQNSTSRFGETFLPGLYIVKITTGKEQKAFRIIKN
jgi:hypothetical protein